MSGDWEQGVGTGRWDREWGQGSMAPGVGDSRSVPPVCGVRDSLSDNPRPSPNPAPNPICRPAGRTNIPAVLGVLESKAALRN